MSRILKNYNNKVTQAYNASTHKGIDIVGEGNKVDDIICHTKGTVVYCDTTYNTNNTKATGVASWGIRVIVQHSGGYYTAYNHLASVAVKKGQSVAKGDKIGRMGNTGCAYGIHLHFEVMKGGQSSSYRINPTPYINADLPSNSTSSTSSSSSNVTGTITYQTYDNTKKKWLDEVTSKGIAGNIGNPVGGIRAKCKNGSMTVQVHIVGGDWLEVVDSSTYSKGSDKGSTYAGIIDKDIDMVKITSTKGYVYFRVYDNVKKKWLAYVKSTTSGAYAGNKGNSIGAIQMY